MAKRKKAAAGGKTCKYGKVSRGRRKGQCLKSKRRPKKKKASAKIASARRSAARTVSGKRRSQARTVDMRQTNRPVSMRWN